MRVRSHQSLRGSLCAIGAHCASDELGTGCYVRLESVAEGRGQRVGGRYDRRVRRSDPEVVDSLCPVVLVVELGYDDLGCSGSRGCGCGARPAVVHDGGDPLEKRLLVDLSDGQAVGFVVQQCQVGPPAGHDRAAAERTAAWMIVWLRSCGARMLPKPK